MMMLLLTELWAVPTEATCRSYRVEPELSPHKHVGEKVTLNAVPSKKGVRPDKQLYWVVQKFKSDRPEGDPEGKLINDGDPTYITGTADLTWKFPEQAIFGVAAFYYDGRGAFDCPSPFSRVQVNKAHTNQNPNKSTEK